MNIINRAVKLASLPVTTGTKYAVAAGYAALMQTPKAQEALEASSNAIIEKITTTLAASKGPAMKFGQTLAMLSSVLPEDQAKMLEPLTRLYEDAEPKNWEEIHPLIKHIEHRVTLNHEPIAAASLGQVHEGTWETGEKVAVKIQYKEAKQIVKFDSMQLKTLAPLFGLLIPNLDVKNIVKEHTDRLEDELDYEKEAAWLKKFRKAWKKELEIPKVIYADKKILVTSWVDGVSLNQATQDLMQRERDYVAMMILKFAFSSPKLVHASHADAHPGNYKITKAGQLGVLDFGSVAKESGVFTELLCNTLICAYYVKTNHSNDEHVRKAKKEIKKLWVTAGLAPENIDDDALFTSLSIQTNLMEGKTKLNTKFLQDAGSEWSDPLNALDKINKLRFPPQYLLEHRSLGGALALACSLDAEVDLREIIKQNASEKIVKNFT
jgi:predicted unusual protein kinase regulating ubiquinone biosynthesis (AarF/ABC1/UbiB family)